MCLNDKTYNRGRQDSEFLEEPYIRNPLPQVRRSRLHKYLDRNNLEYKYHQACMRDPSPRPLRVFHEYRAPLGGQRPTLRRLVRIARKRISVATRLGLVLVVWHQASRYGETNGVKKTMRLTFLTGDLR